MISRGGSAVPVTGGRAEDDRPSCAACEEQGNRSAAEAQQATRRLYRLTLAHYQLARVPDMVGGQP